MFDDPIPLFVLSQTTIPSGNVTFAIVNKCLYGCSFDLQGIKALEDVLHDLYALESLRHDPGEKPPVRVGGAEPAEPEPPRLAGWRENSW